MSDSQWSLKSLRSRVGIVSKAQFLGGLIDGTPSKNTSYFLQNPPDVPLDIYVAFAYIPNFNSAIGIYSHSLPARSHNANKK